jgi:hypothetical protein
MSALGVRSTRDPNLGNELTEATKSMPFRDVKALTNGFIRPLWQSPLSAWAIRSTPSLVSLQARRYSLKAIYWCSKRIVERWRS